MHSVKRKSWEPGNDQPDLDGKTSYEIKYKALQRGDTCKMLNEATTSLCFFLGGGKKQVQVTQVQQAINR